MTLLRQLRMLIMNNKRQLAANLTASGIPACADEPLSTLVHKVAGMVQNGNVKNKEEQNDEQ